MVASLAPAELTPAPSVTPRNGATVAVRQVFVTEDHPIFRHGLVQLINSEPDLMVCGEASSGAQALGALRNVTADLLVLDVSLHGANGIEITKQVLAEHPDLRVLILSMHDESLYALRALRAGACGYVMKREGVEVFLDAIRKVLDGKIHVSGAFNDQLICKVVRGAEAGGITPLDLLTDRELEILQLVGAGKSSREIASDLHLSTKTVESHRLHMKQKLGLGTSTELVRFAVDWVGHQAE